MQLIGYLFGIASDRRLCEEVQLNLAYRWFCQVRYTKDVPDHSSFTRIRDRFGVERYQAIFDRLLQQLRAHGIARGRRVIVDATLVEANASINNLEERPRSDPRARVLKCTSSGITISKRARSSAKSRTKRTSVVVIPMLR